MNKVFLIGNLTREPELTETSAGIEICRFSIAVNRGYKTSSGDRYTDYFKCTSWGTRGETISRYAHKGDRVAVLGSIELNNYDDNNGNKRTDVNINVNEIEFLGQKQNGYTNNSTTNSTNGSTHLGNKTQLQVFDDDSDIPF